jgi:hypothetical protein
MKKTVSGRRRLMLGLGLAAMTMVGCQQASISGEGETGQGAGKPKTTAKSGVSGASQGSDGGLSVRPPAEQLANAAVPDDSKIEELVQKDGGSAQAGVIYVSLAHLAKSGQGTQDLEVYRFGVTKALNSLSMKPEIKRLDALDEGQTVYKVNLADFSLSANSLALVQRVAGANNAIKQVGNSTVIKGDWLVYAVTRPEVYDNIMGVPNFVGALESELKVDPRKAVYWNISSSEVTFAPRVLERIPIEIGGKPGGYYWRSYDFARTDVQRRGFQNPETLRRAGVVDLVAGEYFFSLPNGLQGYMLSGFATQHRIDAQSFVATDSNRPQDGLRRCVGDHQQCGYVINGESCITCHGNGVKINETVSGIKGAAKEEADRLYAQDAQRFASAIREMGFEDQGVEPVKATIQRFRTDNNVTDARRQGSEVSPTSGRGVLARPR